MIISITNLQKNLRQVSDAITRGENIELTKFGKMFAIIIPYKTPRPEDPKVARKPVKSSIEAIKKAITICPHGMRSDLCNKGCAWK